MLDTDQPTMAEAPRPTDPADPTQPQIYKACLLCIAGARHPQHSRANPKIPPVRVCVCGASYGIFRCGGADISHVNPHTQRYVLRGRETLVLFDAKHNGSRCTLEITTNDYNAWCGVLRLLRHRTARRDDLAQRVADIEGLCIANEIQARQHAEIQARQLEYAQKDINECAQRKANGLLAVKLYTLVQLTKELSEMSLVPIEARNESARLANSITGSPMQFLCIAECMVCLSEKNCFYSPQCGHALSRYCWDCYVALPSNHKCLARQSDCPYSQSNARLVQ